MSLRISEAQLLSLAQAALTAAGASAAQAQAVAEVLVWSDLVGRASQGVWRLPVLCERLRQGGIRGDALPRSSAARRGLALCAAPAARAIMSRASPWRTPSSSRASRASARWPPPRATIWAQSGTTSSQAAAAGMIGIAGSNSFPKVLAHGGRRPALGTNPIAFGAPRAGGEAVIVDMATSAAAGSTIRKSAESEARLEQNVAVDAGGKLTSDPRLAGALLPLGGAKGYALGVMVELLCGVLAGPGFGETVRSMYEQPAANGDNGHFMLAIDIARFLPLEQYYERIEALAAWLQASGEPGMVQIPGARRWQARRQNAALGIALDTKTINALGELFRSLRLPLPQSLTPLAA